MSNPKTAAREPAPSTIVVETLRTVFTRQRARKLLLDACEAADLPSVPEAPEPLRGFIEGPLFSELARRLGVVVALELNHQLQEALALAVEVEGQADLCATHEVPVSEVPRAESLVAAEPPPSRRVLAVTQASLVVFLLQDQLGDSIEVLPVSDERQLRGYLRRFGGQPLLVVVDRRHPCVGPSVARLLRRELDRSAVVVWWGADADEQLGVEEALSGGPAFVPTERELKLADLGGVCLRAIE